MKKYRSAFFLLTTIGLLALVSCRSAKSGCPSNGKNVGAERILSGEKVPKAKKFKA